MPDAVHVLAAHPAPVLHVPPRARIERLGIARVETPVRLERLPADAAGRPVLVTPTGRDPWHRIAGSDGLWLPILGQPLQGKGLAVSPEDFVRFLAGRPGGPEWVAPRLVGALARSPLSAYDAGLPLGRRRLHAAGSLGGDRLGAVRVDTRSACASAIQAWLDRDVRLVGERVYRRLSPRAVAMRLDGDERPRWLFRLRSDGLDTGTLDSGSPDLRIDRLAQGLAAWLGEEAEGEPVADDDLSRVIALDLPDVAGDHDLAHLANRLPGHFVGRVDELERLDPRRRGLLDGGVRTRLETSALLGMVGRHGIQDPDAVRDTLATVEAAASAYAEADDTPDTNDLFAIGNFLAWEALPRLAPRPAEGPDAAALGALAP